jgi:hypothetical protein
VTSSVWRQSSWLEAGLAPRDDKGARCTATRARQQHRALESGFICCNQFLILVTPPLCSTMTTQVPTHRQPPASFLLCPSELWCGNLHHSGICKRVAYGALFEDRDVCARGVVSGYEKDTHRLLRLKPACVCFNHMPLGCRFSDGCCYECRRNTAKVRALRAQPTRTRKPLPTSWSHAPRK